MRRNAQYNSNNSSFKRVYGGVGADRFQEFLESQNTAEGGAENEKSARQICL